MLHNLLRTLPVSQKRDWHACLPQVLYCYNTTPHQSTGESPFLLMFGQEPRLPLDFLLGRVESPVGGSVHEWVQEHHARLQVAFDGAREHLKHAADRRRQTHDTQVKHRPLKEGQLVFLRDFTARGPYKTRDRWSSVKYEVLRAPKDGGSVYTIVPLDDQTKVRQVHRTMLKPVVGVVPPDHISPHNLPPVEKGLSEDSGPFDYDLFVCEQQPLVVASALPSGRLLPQTPSQELGPPSEPAASIEPSTSLAVPSTSCADPMALRHSKRPIAGQHTNVHHLPRPAGDIHPGGSSASLSTVSALFRPWN
ncbi:uncharacterized protein LOC118561320 [Fundulus heteroclitus]|uniref:uncharacterized protein LOC118561320 n=1 Tax=Fundulus heteroclitus TaxID=8078 RepID=UPI00165B1574|nr:uncharacterized protein LOC118561320 [Fundulus heteroclitus]XP_035989239.1 uncharacterized protein LOC118561320 [Fundulus heteroclitus]